mmetsp:Transcript_17751/g.68860  ORF Transcript_17751/g.68860 Transcript_17751/m.68860 type:complete len:279 (+) Transcript_17751:334-1170(+)
MEGMEQEMYRSSPLGSMRVMQLELSTFWAGSCPHARYTAVTTLEACALKPPMEPAMAEPTRFFCVFRSSISSTLLFSTVCTMLRLIVASTTTDLPRPSTQLTAAGFLSVHRLPLRLTTRMSGNVSSITVSAFSTPLEIMFMPIASPVLLLNRRKRFFPATNALMLASLPKRLVLLKALQTCLKLSGASIHRLSSTHLLAEGMRTSGALVIPFSISEVCAPPDTEMALQPRCVLAIRQPSVVAIGTVTFSPSISTGPATPTGIGTNPITFSAQAPCTFV